MNKDLIFQLRKVGLNEKAAKVYLTVLEFGGGTPAVIAKKAGLKRTTTYDLLEKLNTALLVESIEKNGKQYYQVSNVESIVDFVKNNIQKEENKLKQAENVLPELEGLMKMGGGKPVIKFYQGIDGLLDIYNSHVNFDNGYEMLVFSNASKFLEQVPEIFMKEYFLKKEKLGIMIRGIVPDSEKDKDYKKIVYNKYKIPKKSIPEIRYVPRNKFPFKGDITIYGENKISLMNFNEKQFVGVILEDKDLHDMLSQIFELAWIGAKNII